MSYDINDQDLHQGVVLLKIIKECSGIVSKDSLISFERGTSKNSFLMKSTDDSNLYGIYIKYQRKNRTPWVFSFAKEHQEEIAILEEYTSGVLVMLVCGRDGIVCLTFEELKELLDDNFEDVEGIRIKRPLRGNYHLSGRDGKLSRTIKRSDLKDKVTNLILQKDNS